MPFKVESVKHVCVVVSSLERATEFYSGVLGFAADVQQPHVFKVNDDVLIHACDSANTDAEPNGWSFQFSSLPTHDDSVARKLNHITFQVDDLYALASDLLDNNQTVFQMDEDGNRRDIHDKSDTLEYGYCSLFVYDPDGNLFEFGQAGLTCF
jgi:catechol 2,3-dioxygenase-like lactoylglutathione lyase family enzyme